MLKLRMKDRFSQVLLMIMGIALMVGGGIAVKRYLFERHHRVVELVVSYNDIKKLASMGGSDVYAVLERLRDEVGITSVALTEDTLADYVQDGKASVLKGSEVLNARRTGESGNFLAARLYGYQKAPKSSNCYVVVDNPEEFEQVRNFLTAEFTHGQVNLFGQWNILEVTDEYDDLMGLGLGLSKEKVIHLNELGFSIIARLKPSPRTTPDLIRQKFLNLDRVNNLHTLLFEGTSVLGDPYQLSLVADRFEEGHYNLGVLEFVPQLGVKELSQRLGKNCLRVHSIPEAELAGMSREKARDRYLRAVKDRNVKIVFLRPIYTTPKKNFIDDNLAFFQRVQKGLLDDGFVLAPIKQMDYGPLSALSIWASLALGAGALAMALLLWSLFTPLSGRLGVEVGIGFLVVFALCSVGDMMDFFNRFFALVAAISFPTYALISQFPENLPEEEGPSRYLHAVWSLVSMVLITLGGSVVVVGLLSGAEFLSGVSLFMGVKAAFIGPVVLVGAFYYLRPYRIKYMGYVIRRLAFSPVRAFWLFVGVVAAFSAFVYIIRSGNNGAIGVSGLEEKIRMCLEDWLLVRPRTKEFLIGYPALFLAYCYGGQKIPKEWTWVFMVLGSVALVSVMNSFCHVHTPLIISLYRVFLGLILGLGFGLLAVGVGRIGRWAFRNWT